MAKLDLLDAVSHTNQLIEKLGLLKERKRI